MITITFNNINYSVNDKILTLSEIAKQQFETHRQVIFVDQQFTTISDINMFVLLNQWLEFAPIKNFSTYDFIFCDFNFYKPKDLTTVFKNLNLKTLIEILNFAIFNQILLLAELISKIISERNISFCEVDGKFYIYEHLPEQFPEPLFISTTIALMISKNVVLDNTGLEPNLSKTMGLDNTGLENTGLNNTGLENRFPKTMGLDNTGLENRFPKTMNLENHGLENKFLETNLPKNLMKLFKYNPTFNENFDRYFSVETNVIDHFIEEPDENKKYIVRNCTYTEFLKYNSQNIKILNIILTAGDFNNVMKLGERYNVLIKSYKDYLTVKKDLEDCSYVYKNLEIPSEFVIPEIITEITPYTFACYRDLLKIFIPDSVTKIDNFAFSGCRNLKHVRMSKNIKEIGKQAFEFCDVRKIYIPESIEKIGYKAFVNNKNISIIYV